ncbi:hypothetical protein D3C79_1065380 [compost metagenome]
MHAVGEGQGGRIRHGAGQQTAQGEVIDLAIVARQHPDHQQRDQGDGHAIHHPGGTIPVDQGVDEAGP